MRTSYGPQAAMGREGDIVSLHKDGFSAPAKENIYPGRVVGFTGTERLGYQHPSPNKFTLSGTLSSGTVDLNVEIKTFVDGVETTTGAVPIGQVTYSGSHATTMGLIEAAIELLVDAQGDLKLAATVDTNSITVVHSDQAVIILSGGASSQGLTFTYPFDGTIDGPVDRGPVEAQADGTVYYPPGTPVYAMTQGKMTVTFVDASDLSSALAVQHIANGTTKPRGAIRNTTDSGKATAFTSMKVAVGAGALAKGNVQLNNP